MPLLAALLLSFAPAFGCAALVYWIDRYEKEPLPLLSGLFAWGAVVAIVGAAVSEGLLSGVVQGATGSEKAADIAGTVVFAPLAEESLKGIALLLVFLFLRFELDSILDGLVYAGIVALGFAATENVFYLYDGFTSDGWSGLFHLFFLRSVLGAWDHPFYTSFLGIGLAVARLNRSPTLRRLAPPIGWGVAVGFHALHNTLATLSEAAPGLGLMMFMVDWSGWIGISGLILWAVYREGKLVGLHLAEEVALGRMTAAQLRTAASGRARSAARVRAAMTGQWRETCRFYQVCGELAHKKHLRERLGEEGCAPALVERLRDELARLSSQAVA
jgi:RsiW-degrading membrane proteinase PrsW (M82 family)